MPEDTPQSDRPVPTGPGTRRSRWLTRLVASHDFQARTARNPLTRARVRAEGEAMFDLVAGFCHSQILQAFVRLDLHKALLLREMTAEALGEYAKVPPDGMRVLLAGAEAIGLIKRGRAGYYGLTTRGAALAGVPGLAGMIDHHDVLYMDLADPVAFFRGEVETELAAFWPYVFGAAGAQNPDVAQRYSELMADSQVLVAEDTLDVVSLSGVTTLLDVGGGTGTFLAAVGAAYSDLQLMLFDLPAVAPGAEARFAAAGLSDRAQVVWGSFRDDPLPKTADMISLVRVLYDHADDTVAALLRAVYTALPAGGRILISEPMTGGDTPQRAGDAYFALYCMAMRTGRARSQAEIGALLQEAGFADLRMPKARRPFITSVVEAVKPA